LVNAEYDPSFAFANSLLLDHVVLGFEADAKAYLFCGRLLLCRALLFGLLLRLLAGSTPTPARCNRTGGGAIRSALAGIIVRYFAD
jgi:hypothetical protein